ncbi:UNVERIFIED_CONTAM: hypothetical protein HDU68_004307 [Siphonaria sp. JEL0065]|nr:hypothetical protein HDU68_004307 [Siphonaria sp. JEL0065]
MCDLIDENKQIRFGDFESNTENFNGSFKCLAYLGSGGVHLDDQLLQLFGVVSDGIVVEFVIVLEPKYS